MNFTDIPLDELWSYRPEQTKEPDFDVFWSKNLREAKEQPLNAEEFPIRTRMKNVNAFDVYYDGFVNSRIHGVLILPKAASGDNKVPVVVMFHGYNYNNLILCDAYPFVMAGYAVFLSDTRGQDVKSPDLNHYENGSTSGWMTLGIMNKENYYYKYVYLDAVRAIEYLCSRCDIDENRVCTVGESQGGGIALAAGALSQRVNVILANVPFLCHFRRAVLKATDLPYLEISRYFLLFDQLHETEDAVYRTLSYFDNLNLCSRISADLLMAVGLEDTVCPPSTSFAVYNTVASNKQMCVYPDFAHGGFFKHEDKRLEYLMERFQ